MPIKERFKKKNESRWITLLLRQKNFPPTFGIEEMFIKWSLHLKSLFLLSGIPSLLALRQIDVTFSVCVWSLDVLSFYEALDSFLDDDRWRLEPGAELFHNLWDELIVVELLSTLHDSNDASLDLVLSILVNFLKWQSRSKKLNHSIIVVQWGSEIRTSLDFEWSKKVG